MAPDLPRETPGESENRTERRRRETHESLLDATLRLLIDNGAAGFSVTDVVDLADVAGGTFYNHFGDRDEAIREVVSRIIAQNAGQVEMLAGDDPLDGFVALWLVNANRSLRDLEFARMVDNVIHSHLWPLGDSAPPALVMLHEARTVGRIHCTPEQVELCYLIVAGAASGHAKASLSGVTDALGELSDTIVATMVSTLGVDGEAMAALIERMTAELAGVEV